MKITRRQLRTLIESVLREEKNFGPMIKVIHYTVKKGDTLSDLHKEKVQKVPEGSGPTVQDQIELNGKDFDGDNLSVGQVIKLYADIAAEQVE